MEFNKNKAIYLQIVDLICERILKDQFLPGERIPSIREMAKELSVNPNTIVKAYDSLENMGVLYNKRGMGYFMTPEGKEQALRSQRELLIQIEMPAFMQLVERVGMGAEELVQYYYQFTTPGCSIS